MMTHFAPWARRGGSLAALAAALALTTPAVPAAAQEMPTFQPDDPASAPEVRVPRVDPSGGPAQAEIMRPERPERAERPERPERPRFEPVASPQPSFTPPPPPAYAPPARIDPDIEAGAALAQRERGDRRGRGGFGGGFGGGNETGGPAAQPAPTPFPGADRSDRGERRGWRGGEVRDDGDIARSRRGEIRARGWQPDQAPATQQQQQQQQGWQGRRGDQGAIGSGDWQRGRSGDGQRDRNANGRGGWGDGRRDDFRRDGWQDRGRSDWRDGNRTDWNGGRRDDWRGNGWRDDRRDDWRRRDGRNWRQDDWRWSWNGRPGWDSRDFRRWDNRWRSNRSYDWNDYRRSNRFIFHPGPYFAPYRSHRYSRLSIGFFLDSLCFQPRFFINDPWSYRLPPAYGPYQWVRYYDDVVLVDIYTGEVVDVLYDFFW